MSNFYHAAISVMEEMPATKREWRMLKTLQCFYSPKVHKGWWFTGENWEPRTQTRSPMSIAESNHLTSHSLHMSAKFKWQYNIYFLTQKNNRKHRINGPFFLMNALFLYLFFLIFFNRMSFSLSSNSHHLSIFTGQYSVLGSVGTIETVASERNC